MLVATPLENWQIPVSLSCKVFETGTSEQASERPRFKELTNAIGTGLNLSRSSRRQGAGRGTFSS